MRITRRLEFDAGHRIPDHKSQCRHLHGHRYALEITLEGHVLDAPGTSDNGMVMDFSDVKKIAQDKVVNHWDHAFLAYEKDHLVVDFLATLPNHKTVLLAKVPTAENLAKEAFNTLQAAYQSRYGNQIRLTHIRLYETPNCWADVDANG